MLTGTITIRGHKLHQPIDRDTIVQLFNFEIYELDEDKLEDTYLIEVKKLLFVEPLERVPLFISDFPELARWRLRIAK